MTTKPASKPNVLTVPELFALADQALAMEKPVRGVDRYWLVALALQESGGDPTAIGDGGLAWGLHQFHEAAWEDCWGARDAAFISRYDPLSSFRAAIRYQRLAGKGLIRAQPPKTLRACRSSRHHLGHYDLTDTKYINSVERRFQKLVKEYGRK